MMDDGFIPHDSTPPPFDEFQGTERRFSRPCHGESAGVERRLYGKDLDKQDYSKVPAFVVCIRLGLEIITIEIHLRVCYHKCYLVPGTREQLGWVIP